jgi:hypothetical protein
MGLAIHEIMRGAQVALAFDERGKRLPIQRKGIIVKVQTVAENDTIEDNGDPRNGIKSIWVQFEKGHPPESVKNCQLALIRGFDQTEYGKLKRQEMNEKAEAGLEEPYIIDKTDLPDAKPLKSEDVEKFETAPRRGRPPKNLMTEEKT